MNFKGFKKVGEDEHKAHFENKQGHIITIAKKGLSQKHLKQLGELPLHAAEGGDIMSYNKEEPEFLKKFHEAGPMSSYENELAKQVETGKSRTAAANSTEGVYDAMGGEKGWRRAGQPKPEEPKPTLAEMPMTKPTDEPTLAPNEVQPDQVQQPAPQMAPQPRQPAQQPQQPQMDYRQSPEYQKSAADYKAKKIPEWAQEDINWQRDLQNGHVTPETYGSLFAKQDTLGKIGTLFGLMVSGVGSGLSKQPNLVMQMMDNEIKNDLEAQMKSKDNAMNYYKAQQAAYLQKAQAGQAESETALNWQTAAINKMRIAAWQKMQSQVNRLPNGQQKMQAQGMVDSLGAAVQEKNMQDNVALAESVFFEIQKSLRHLQMMGDTSAGQIADEREKHFFPGLGESGLAVPEHVKAELSNKKVFSRAAREYLAFAEKHKNNWANLNPKQRLAVAEAGAIIAAELQGKYRIKTEGGVYKESEQDFIKKLVPHNAQSAFAAFNQIPKLKQLIKNNDSEIASIAEDYQFERKEFQHPTAGYTDTTTAPRGAAGETVVWRGKKYRRGPDGKAIEVK